MHERIQSGLIKTTHVSSAQQIIDIFIKPLGSSLFHTLILKLGTLDIHILAWEGMLEIRDCNYSNYILDFRYLFDNLPL